MKHYFDVLKWNSLFEGITYEELSSMFNCLGAFAKTFDKKEMILQSGDPTRYMGIVISGSVKVLKEDCFANETILMEVGVGDTFGEVFACADVSHSPVTVIAKEKSEVLFLNYKKVITTCNHSCEFHARLTENLLKIIANKCLSLNKKLEIVSQRTTREKILSYLLYVGKGKKKFKISMNREEMANYLCVDRSAMSAELSKMKKEGLIRFDKNEFEIISQ